MNLRRAFLTLCVGSLVLSAASVCQGIIDTARIEEIIKKTSLTQGDLQEIDEFAADAVANIVQAVDFTEVSKTRSTILKYQSGKLPEFVKQYSDSTYTHLEKGLAAALDSSDSARRSKVVTNLLILADSLKDPRAVDLAVKMVADKEPPVRYWAVRLATDPNLWSRLNQNQATAAQTTAKLMTELIQAAPTSTPEVLVLMSGFAGSVNAAAADELLTRIADTRIKQYTDWTVSYEMADMTILRQLGNKILAGSAAKSQLAKRFAQLYSFAIQRYLKGQSLGLLRDPSRDYLAAVLIDTEDKCLGKLLGAPQTTIRRAIESNDAKALQTEHDRLFSALPGRFGFTYGGEGQSLQAPIPLLDPTTRPATAVSSPAAPK